MKIRIEIEVDTSTGVYDVKFHNLTNPGEDIDVNKIVGLSNKVLANVLDNVQKKNSNEYSENSFAEINNKILN